MATKSEEDNNEIYNYMVTARMAGKYLLVMTEHCLIIQLETNINKQIKINWQ